MIRSRDIDLINRAFKICDKYKESGIYTLVAILAEGKRVKSIGVNDYKKTHPNTPQIYSTHIIPTHAEIDCISKWIVKNRRITEDMSLYVVGYTKAKSSEVITSSRPCPSCQVFIKKVGLSRVVYIENNEDSFEIKEWMV